MAVARITRWRRSRRPTSPIHPEFALGTDTTADVPAAAEPPRRESYYAQAPPSRAKGRPMGWYSVNGDYGDERYWDGRTWTARRQMVAGAWSAVPVGAD
jgi:hypothetical protein